MFALLISVMASGFRNEFGTYCGNSVPANTLTSMTNVAFVRFQSDHSFSGSGFALAYKTGKPLIQFVILKAVESKKDQKICEK